MGSGKLTQSEIKELQKNPFVSDVNERRIIYSDEFKLHFIEEYMCNKTPSEIFTESGFDVSALGLKRIERACARWKAAFYSGTLTIDDDILNSISDKRIKSRMKSRSNNTLGISEEEKLRQLLDQSEKQCAELLKIIEKLREKNREAMRSQKTQTVK